MKKMAVGLIIQVYRGVIPGVTHEDKIKNLTDKLDLYHSLGIAGIAMHGFTTELDPHKFLELAQLCHVRGLKCFAAYGLDAVDPVGKAHRMAAVAVLPECDGILFDMEGAWDSNKTAEAKQMGDEFRRLAPDALVYDQPWPEPTQHWHFPWEEVAGFVDAHASQYYVQDWQSQYGKNRYEKCWPLFDSCWARLNARLAPKNLVRPAVYTIEGYRWELEDLIDCLVKHETLFVWAEPWIDDVFIKAIQVKNKLASLGFTGPDAVKQYQASVGLVADGVTGPMTLAKLAI